MEQSYPAKRRKLSNCNTMMGLSGCLSACTNTNNKRRASLNDLTDDLLCQILLRVPDVKSLHRSKCVSKHWLSLLSAPSFARSFILSHNHPAAIQNMILYRVVRGGGASVGGQVYALPLDNSKSSLPLPFTFDFVPALKPYNYDHHNGRCPEGVTERVLIDMDLLGVCGGFVLLRGFFRDRTDDATFYENSTYYCYYVCNPVTKQWVELPLIPSYDVACLVCYYPQQAQGKGRDSPVWAHATSRESIINQIDNLDPDKIEFTVISIDIDEEEDLFFIRVLSSTDEVAEWNIFRVPFPPGSRWKPLLHNERVVFLNGMFHWCGKNAIAAYDPFNKPLLCDVIPYPFEEVVGLVSLCLEVCEGKLRVVTMELRMFSVWELVDYANKVWVKKFDVNINHLYLFGFQSFVGDADPDQVYMVDYYSSSIKLYNVKNLSVQDVYTHPDLRKDDSLKSIQPFISSPWPAPISLQWR